MIDIMPGQHRKQTAAWKLTPPAVCGSVATVAAVLGVAIQLSSVAQPAAAVETSSSSAVESESATTTAPPTALLAPAAMAIEPPLLVEKVAIQHLPPPIPCSTELSGTRPHVAQVGHLLKKTFGVAEVGGAVGRYDGDHGAGLALDLMTSDFAHGDAIAEFVLANRQRFGVNYVIWRQRYNDGNGWSYMENRGSPTANHYDHVHVSFDRAAQVDVTC
ncbi:hypothetical protein [Nocardia amikacinitolerans]|uniref:hypothetical protein n=1 Tax=Nocardia amikacinitolerans TaxID=756689 RepID=UPI0027D778D6|nr:hypothetical protein [Nocardia amikacinitolerans]